MEGRNSESEYNSEISHLDFAAEPVEELKDKLDLPRPSTVALFTETLENMSQDGRAVGVATATTKEIGRLREYEWPTGQALEIYRPVGWPERYIVTVLSPPDAHDRSQQPHEIIEEWSLMQNGEVRRNVTGFSAIDLHMQELEAVANDENRSGSDRRLAVEWQQAMAQELHEQQTENGVELYWLNKERDGLHPLEQQSQLASDQQVREFMMKLTTAQPLDR